MISYMTSKTMDYTDGTSSPEVIYKSECSCQSPHHILTMSYELVEDKNGEHVFPPELQLQFYVKTSIYEPWSIMENWFVRNWKRLWFRIKVAFKVLFYGYYESEDYFLFRDEDHISTFIDALIEGKTKMNLAMKSWAEKRIQKGE